VLTRPRNRPLRLRLGQIDGHRPSPSTVRPPQPFLNDLQHLHRFGPSRLPKGLLPPSADRHRLPRPSTLVWLDPRQRLDWSDRYAQRAIARRKQRPGRQGTLQGRFGEGSSVGFCLEAAGRDRLGRFGCEDGCVEWWSEAEDRRCSSSVSLDLPVVLSGCARTDTNVSSPFVAFERLPFSSLTKEQVRSTALPSRSSWRGSQRNSGRWA
jgi:hypothetical protein